MYSIAGAGKTTCAQLPIDEEIRQRYAVARQAVRERMLELLADGP